MLDRQFDLVDRIKGDVGKLVALATSISAPILTVDAVRVILIGTSYRTPADAEAIRPPVIRYLFKPFQLMSPLESLRAAFAARERKEPFDREQVVTPFELVIG